MISIPDLQEKSKDMYRNDRVLRVMVVVDGGTGPLLFHEEVSHADD